MKPKEKLEQLTKNVSDLKNKAGKISQDAMKAAGTVKEVLNQGVNQSKTVLEKASKAINRNGISQGIDVTSKGVDMVAKGAKFASKGVETLANSMEKASSGMRQISRRLKKQD